MRPTLLVKEFIEVKEQNCTHTPRFLQVKEKRHLGLEHLAPHDLRRTCAKVCHVNGGELEQIQFLLGHASVLTTERYLGCKQNLEEPVNDRFGCLFSRTLDLR